MKKGMKNCGKNHKENHEENLMKKNKEAGEVVEEIKKGEDLEIPEE